MSQSGYHDEEAPISKRPHGLVEVVSSVLTHPTSVVPRILMCQRPEGKDLALVWETPGGKVEKGESQLDALTRELREELGIEIEFPKHEKDAVVWRGRVELATKPIMLTFLRVARFAGKITPTEGQGWGWFTKQEYDMLNVTPGNMAARDHVAMRVWKP